MPSAFRDGPRTRQGILRVIQAQPGISKSELARALGLAWGTVTHHLRMLEEAGLVTSQRIRARVRFFDASLEKSQLINLAFLENPARGVLDCLQPGRAVGIAELSKELAISRKVVRRQLELLVNAGLVSKDDSYRPRFELAESSRVEQILEAARK